VEGGRELKQGETRAMNNKLLRTAGYLVAGVGIVVIGVIILDNTVGAGSLLERGLSGVEQLNMLLGLIEVGLGMWLLWKGRDRWIR